jgi:hypothetical protein
MSLEGAHGGHGPERSAGAGAPLALGGPVWGPVSLLGPDGWSRSPEGGDVLGDVGGAVWCSRR